jgi:hypothetical protein
MAKTIALSEATIEASLEAAQRLLTRTLQAAQALEGECAPSAQNLTLHGLWCGLTNHLAATCGWTPFDLSRTALAFADIALRTQADSDRKHKPMFYVMDLQTDLYYDPASDTFGSPSPIAIEQQAIQPSFYSSPRYFLTDTRDYGSFNLDYARFERWLWTLPAFVDQPDLNPKIWGAARALANAKWLRSPPSHVIFVRRGRFRAFRRELAESLGLGHRDVCHVGHGVIGIRTAEHAALISLMGYQPVAYAEIQRRLNGATSWMAARPAAFP